MDQKVLNSVNVTRNQNYYIKGRREGKKNTMKIQKKEEIYRDVMKTKEEIR